MLPTKAELVKRRERWATSLESGKFTQTQGWLHDAGGYCCLGVACEISGLGEWELFKTTNDDERGIFNFIPSSNGKPGKDEIENKILPPSVMQWLGISTGNFDLNKALTWSNISRRTASLSEANDSGISFKEIAAIIRKEPIKKEMYRDAD